MIDRKIFFEQIRKSLFAGRIGSRQVEGINAILDVWLQSGVKDPRFLAYILATAYHETAWTFQPIKERGGASYLIANYDITGRRPRLAHANGNIHQGDGARYAGRGFVQLTWRNNYRSVGKKLGLDLETNPQLAMQIDIAAIILVRGMQEGWFTGRKLAQYFNDSTEDWINARRTVNGLDKAASIAAKGKLFFAAIARSQEGRSQEGRSQEVGLQVTSVPKQEVVSQPLLPLPEKRVVKRRAASDQRRQAKAPSPKLTPSAFEMPPIEGRR